MTRFVGEPSGERKGRQGVWGVEDLRKRPMPSDTSRVKGVQLFSWNYATNNLVPTATWTAITGGTNVAYYEEAFEFPLSSGFAWDFDAGSITNGTDGLYIAVGMVQFWDDAVVGESRAIAINHGSSLRYVNEFTCTTTTGVGDHHLTVTESWLNGAGTYSASLECWHDHGSDITIRDASFSVYLMGHDLDAAQFTLRP